MLAPQSRFGFCPQCGHALGWRLVEARQRQVCPRGHVFYRNARPAVAALVRRGSEVLLVRRAVAPFQGWWDIPGGFLEADEGPEAGLVREVAEETGLTVRPGAFLGSWLNPYGSQPDDDDWVLNLLYEAIPAGGREQAGDDAAALGWFRAEELPAELAFAGSREALLAGLRRLDGAVGPLSRTDL